MASTPSTSSPSSFLPYSFSSIGQVYDLGSLGSFSITVNNMCNPNMNASERTEAAPPPPTTNLYRSPISIVPDAAAGACECSKSAGFIDPPTHQPSHHHYHYREIFSEAKSLIHLCFPIGIAGLLLYARSVVSMLFLGSLGELELATGSLAIAFANITGYSIISAFSFIHPIPMYLWTQGITLPITISSLAAAVFHVPANLLLVTRLWLGVPGVAASSSSASNCFALLFLVSYLFIAWPSTFSASSSECLSGWKPLLRLSAPMPIGLPRVVVESGHHPPLQLPKFLGSFIFFANYTFQILLHRKFGVIIFQPHTLLPIL